jgi:prepilin-type processing-associated H-X9-DG protein
MMTQFTSARRGVTRVDVLALIAVGGFVTLLVAGRLPPPTQTDVWEPVSAQMMCGFNLQQMGRAIEMFRADHGAFYPGDDDGGVNTPNHIMFATADLLYDLSYLNTTQTQTCPTDARPDPAAQARAASWGFHFIDRFGVGETPKFGVRSSYAINSVLTYNWPADRYADASRQVLMADGAWTWLMCLNAAWFYYDEVTGQTPPPCYEYPTWWGTMVAWRHLDAVGNAVFCDGSVRPLTPIQPATPAGLQNGTFDTEQAFTWLPGEQTVRLDNDGYGVNPSHPEWQGRSPALRHPSGGWQWNPAAPIDSDLDWRSEHNAWIRLPNPADRW